MMINSQTILPKRMHILMWLHELVYWLFAIWSISKIACLSGTQVAFETKVTNRAIGYLHSLVHFFSFLVNDNAFPCVNKIHKDQMELGWVTKIGTRLYRELLKADSRVANRRSEPLHGGASLLVRPPAAGQMTNSIARTMHTAHGGDWIEYERMSGIDARLSRRAQRR